MRYRLGLIQGRFCHQKVLLMAGFSPARMLKTSSPPHSMDLEFQFSNASLHFRAFNRKKRPKGPVFTRFLVLSGRLNNSSAKRQVFHAFCRNLQT
jgi:hypothetical protein